MSSTEAPVDRLTEIRRAIDVLTVPNGVIEIRAPSVPSNGWKSLQAGYFLDRDKATQAAWLLDKQKAEGVYLVLNEIDPALLARSADRLTKKLEPATSDKDILRRRWLYIDLDAIRPAGISSTEEQHAAAREVAEFCRDWLRYDAGWPDPVFADSGNGYHPLYRIDLPNNSESDKLIADVLAALGQEINTPQVKVDLTAKNAARICKLYGTYARKGDDMPDRPHRLSHIIDVPDPVQVVTVEQLQAVAALLRKDNEQQNHASNGSSNATYNHRLDVPRWLRDRGVGYKEKERPDANGRKIFILDTCPFNSEHKNGEVCVMQWPNGKLGASCKHHSCQNKGWEQFKDAIGGPDRAHFDPPLSDHRNKDKEASPSPPPWTGSLRQLIIAHPNQRPPVIEGLLRVGETMNDIAKPKRGKSWFVYGLANSVAAGGTWLDKFKCTQGRVLLIDGELHPEVIAHRIPLVADAMGLGRDYLDMIDVWPLRGLGYDLETLRPLIEAVEPGRYKLVILDAWYRFLPRGISENENADVMHLYNQIDGYASRLQAAWVNVHHTSKGDQSGKGTTDIGSGAGSQSRAADTHLVLRDHEQDDVAVVEAAVRSWPPVERFTIRWEFPTWKLDTAADPTKLWGPKTARDRTNKEDKDNHLDEDRQTIVNAVFTHKELVTKTDARDLSRIGNPRFGFAWASLLQDKTIIPAGEIKKRNGQIYESFSLSHKDMDA